MLKYRTEDRRIVTSLNRGSKPGEYMQAGFLVIAADATNDGVLLLAKSNDAPDVEKAAANNIVWVGRFNDIDTAQMHAHGLYCKELLDVDAGSYSIGKGRAIAAIEGDILLQETVYISPDLSPQDQAEKEQWQLIYKRRKQRFEAIIFVLKVLSLGFLLFILLMSF